MPAPRVAARLRAVPPPDPGRVPAVALGADPETAPARWLPRPARAHWRRVIRSANRVRPLHVQVLDLDVVAAYCFWLWVLEEAGGDVVDRGVLVAGRSSADEARGEDRLVKNRSISVAREATDQLRHLAVELGLSPRSRHGLSLGPVDQPTLGDDLWD